MTALDFFRDQPASLLGTWEPFSRDFDRMFREMERAFGTQRHLPGSLPRGPVEFVPACDIEETKGEYHLSLDAPGLEKEDIQIEVVGNTVKISGESKQDYEENAKNQCRIERTYGKFSRLFTLPEGVNEDGIEATYDNGVLHLALPKSKESKAKRIAVKAGKPGFVAKIAGKGKK